MFSKETKAPDTESHTGEQPLFFFNSASTEELVLINFTHFPERSVASHHSFMSTISSLLSWSEEPSTLASVLNHYIQPEI